MPQPIAINLVATDLTNLPAHDGFVAVFVTPDGKFDASARKVNSLTRKALVRLVEGTGFQEMEEGAATLLSYPAGMGAIGIIVVKLARNADVASSRAAGVSIAKMMGTSDVLMLAGGTKRPEEVALGLRLRAYSYDAQKSSAPKSLGQMTMMVNKPDEVDLATGEALAAGVHFTRDLVNAPANVLTTTAFADQIADMREIGLDVEILEEAELEKLGMGSLLCVGQGSASPSKVAIMQWNGGGEEPPFALVGKGVVFDTGGISLKPAAGMEDMTMDMGGAGVVAGVMRSLALRKAAANVVGLVGLVENMPSGEAVRPGDVVTSMKGDTIEVINTDAEGRLVLADVLWYAQERFKPSGMINLATLTGAMLVALGHEKAGVFSNSDQLSAQFIRSAEAEGEGAWRMPMGPAYDKLLKSDIADMKNVGGRFAGSITAAQFLGRFVKEDVPWCHLDIAGTAAVKSETSYAPKGATGWGVLALNRLIADHYES